MYPSNTTLFLIIYFLQLLQGAPEKIDHVHGDFDDGEHSSEKKQQHRQLEDALLNLEAFRAPYEAVLQMTNGMLVVTNVEPWKEIKKEKKIKSSIKKIIRSIPLQEGIPNKEKKSIRKQYTKLLKKKGDSAVAVGDLLYRVAFQMASLENEGDFSAFTLISVATDSGLIKFDAVLDSILTPPEFSAGDGSFECAIPQDEDPFSEMDPVAMVPEGEVGGGGQGGGQEGGEIVGEEGAEVGGQEGEDVGGQEGEDFDLEDKQGGGFNRRLNAPEGVDYMEWKNLIGVRKAWGQIKVRALASDGCDADFTATFQAAAAFPFVAEPRTDEPPVTVCCAKKDDCECTKDGEVIPNAMECGQSSKAFTIIGRIGLSFLSADLVDYPGEVKAWVCADGTNGPGNF